MEFHESVLLKESIEGLKIRPDGAYVDATYGGGGHSREIIHYLNSKGRLFGFDQDEDAIINRIEDQRFIMIESNFRYLKNFLTYYKAIPVDGILADLGISSFQIDTPGRGFSTRFEGKLDMRMDRRKKLTAGTIINEYDEKRLSDIFFEYGEIINARHLAKTIGNCRNEKAIETTMELKAVIEPLAGRGRENKFLAQVFQALRIEVNGELESLKKFLIQSAMVLNKGGRLVVISYHSLEDKLVKNFFRSGNFTGEISKDFYGNFQVPLNAINRKPIVPCDDEILRNSRSRSAKLRIAEKI
ncbi:MAG: 16S rRNA (cytosine(1402)-N(4))-methyltransferase RsmH [Bacteroidetes bacterium]|nr:16S rRNA (cytosine(1402)-N(4))-methyltransferase RsmH [Bacteroidota bacterium]